MADEPCERVRFEWYGEADLLQVVQVPRPRASAGRAVVQVKAPPTNPGEASIRMRAAARPVAATFPEGDNSQAS